MAFVTTYNQVKANKPKRLTKKLRDGMRNTVLLSLSGYYKKTGAFEDSFNKNRIQFLYIHHLFKDEEHNFYTLIKKLNENHTFLSYSNAVDKLQNGSIDKPYIVFSSDDGFINNIRAAEILSEFGISACFFVMPEMVGEVDLKKIEHFNSKKLNLPPIEYLSWNNLETLKQTGHEIGSHTLTHARLSEENTDELREEIEKSRNILSHKVGAIDHFSWPYGRFHHFNEQARKIVFKSGYTSCASAERGCHIKSSAATIPKTQLCIRRDIIVLDAPLDTILYFIARNAYRATEQNNYFPY